MSALSRCAATTLPKTKPGNTDILLYLALLSACCRVTEIQLEPEMASHGAKAHIELALLATPDLTHCGRHVVVADRLRKCYASIEASKLAKTGVLPLLF